MTTVFGTLDDKVGSYDVLGYRDISSLNWFSYGLFTVIYEGLFFVMASFIAGVWRTRDILICSSCVDMLA